MRHWKFLSLTLLTALLAGAGCGDVVTGYDGGTGELTPQVRELFPAATSAVSQRVEGTYYKEAWQDDQLLGYAFTTEHYGYQSEIRILTGLDADGLAVGVVVLDQNETPSYWRMISDNWLAAFSGLELAELDAEARDFGPYEIDGITGATKTSVAIINAFWDAVDLYLAMLTGQ